MKKNLPVTEVEKTFDETDNILSTTDLKGTIKYVNGDFCKIAGFSENELLNKNHNIIRHPDMPPAAFKDLWNTIKAGNPWMGVVKNRCKNGDYYWVDAFVTPIKKLGKIVEYQSVRFIPKKDATERAQKTYKSLMDGKLPHVVAKKNIPLKLKVFLATILAFTPFIVSSFISPSWQIPTLIVSLLLSLILISRLLNRLTSLSQQAKKIYSSPLMSHIYTNSTDEIGAIELGLKMKATELRAILGRIKDSSIQIQTTASKSSQIMQNTSNDVIAQQAEIHQLVSAIEEMSNSFKEVAQNCEQSASDAEIAMGAINEGSQVAQQAINTNQQLMKEIDNTTVSIENLANFSEKISSVIDVIQNIAEQTNLLALNAAIEAARAGDQGRGFAVVADEVRQLANRTQKSTLEIEEMINNLTAGAANAAENMTTSKHLFEKSTNGILDTEKHLQLINQQVQSIVEMSTGIATTTEEQSYVAEDISKNITNISIKIDETADCAQMTMQMSKKFSDLAVEQSGLVEQFIQ